MSTRYVFNNGYASSFVDCDTANSLKKFKLSEGRANEMLGSVVIGKIHAQALLLLCSLLLLLSHCLQLCLELHDLALAGCHTLLGVGDQVLISFPASGEHRFNPSPTSHHSMKTTHPHPRGHASHRLHNSHHHEALYTIMRPFTPPMTAPDTSTTMTYTSLPMNSSRFATFSVASVFS